MPFFYIQYGKIWLIFGASNDRISLRDKDAVKRRDMEENRLFDYKEFIDNMKLLIEKKVGKEYRVHLRQEMKNNSIRLDGILIQREGEQVVPSIYLNHYYDRYVAGEPIEILTEQIIGLSSHHKTEITKLQNKINLTPENIRENLYFRLVNRQKNQHLLEGIPHRIFWDLAITFHFIVYEENEKIGSIMLTKEHLEAIGWSEEEVMQFALQNTPRLFPVQLRTMEEVLNELCRKENLSDEDLIQDNFIEPMYVLGNKRGINGAACILYPGMLNEIADKLQCDYYVLPSSIHELIILRNLNKSEDELGRMVREINRTQVPEEEVLSDSIYYYSIEQRELRQVPENLYCAEGRPIYSAYA